MSMQEELEAGMAWLDAVLINYGELTKETKFKQLSANDLTGKICPDCGTKNYLHDIGKHIEAELRSRKTITRELLPTPPAGE